MHTKLMIKYFFVGLKNGISIFTENVSIFARFFFVNLSFIKGSFLDFSVNLQKYSLTFEIIILIYWQTNVN